MRRGDHHGLVAAVDDTVINRGHRRRHRHVPGAQRQRQRRQRIIPARRSAPHRQRDRLIGLERLAHRHRDRRHRPLSHPRGHRHHRPGWRVVVFDGDRRRTDRAAAMRRGDHHGLVTAVDDTVINRGHRRRHRHVPGAQRQRQRRQRIIPTRRSAPHRQRDRLIGLERLAHRHRDRRHRPPQPPSPAPPPPTTPPCRWVVCRGRGRRRARGLRRRRRRPRGCGRWTRCRWGSWFCWRRWRGLWLVGAARRRGCGR